MLLSSWTLGTGLLAAGTYGYLTSDAGRAGGDGVHWGAARAAGATLRILPLLVALVAENAGNRGRYPAPGGGAGTIPAAAPPPLAIYPAMIEQSPGFVIAGGL